MISDHGGVTADKAAVCIIMGDMRKLYSEMLHNLYFLRLLGRSETAFFHII